MQAFGGVVAIDIAGGEAEVEKLFNSLRLVRTAPSLGGVETLASYPLYSSHAGFSAEQLKAAGVSAATVRFASASKRPKILSLTLQRRSKHCR